MYGNLGISEIEEKNIIKTCSKVIDSNERWPIGYWDGDIGKIRAIVCMRFVMYDLLDWSDYNIETTVNKSFFNKYKLQNMLKKVFNNDVYSAIHAAFPEKEYLVKRLIEKRNLKQEIQDNLDKIKVDKEYRKQILFRILKMKGYTPAELNKLSRYDLDIYNFSEVFYELYNENWYKMAEDLIPNTYFEWDFFNHLIHPKESFDFWEDKSNRKMAFDLLKLSIKNDKINLSKIDVNYFENLSLETLLDYYSYKNSRMYFLYRNTPHIYPIFEEFSPESVKPWMVKEEGSEAYWESDRCNLEEVLSYILQSLDITKEELPKLTYDDLDKLYLGRMLSTLFEGYVYNFANHMMPNRFNIFDFKEIPGYMWFDNDFREQALINLLSELGINTENLNENKENIIETLRRYNFDNSKYKPLINYYKGSLVSMLKCIFPDIFSEYEFDDLERKYEDLFGNYKELKLVEYYKDKDAWYIDSGELDKIFTPNPNAWSSRCYSFDNIYKNTEEYELVKLLSDNSITVYKYDLKEPKEPNGEKEEDAYNFLLTYSKARNLNIGWLYWRAYNFFKDKGYYLTYPSNTVYMGLSHKNTMFNHYYSDLNDKSPIINLPIDTTLGRDIKTVVRCGALEINRLQTEFVDGCDYLWVFPFIYTTDELLESGLEPEISAYLIKCNTDLREVIMHKTYLTAKKAYRSIYTK